MDHVGYWPEEGRREGVPMLLVLHEMRVEVFRHNVQVELPHGRDGVEPKAEPKRHISLLLLGPLRPLPLHVEQLLDVARSEVLDGLELAVGRDEQRMAPRL
eukprot:CAMPEP_0177600748 /NCGR_PEP_ID=MMETSP0419_2-20121207/13845_1 /TAXON_ID=582737 /ORGANISM="Tetraselmis sp., Strain GSL018" /LENGTH=100 /DNA_ID=CAMNT_0019093875 /DNA_START=197 /DNA_END=495 /DNA_ORIENTATION=+